MRVVSLVLVLLLVSAPLFAHPCPEKKPDPSKAAKLKSNPALKTEQKRPSWVAPVAVIAGGVVLGWALSRDCDCKVTVVAAEKPKRGCK